MAMRCAGGERAGPGQQRGSQQRRASRRSHRNAPGEAQRRPHRIPVLQPAASPCRLIPEPKKAPPLPRLLRVWVLGSPWNQDRGAGCGEAEQPSPAPQPATSHDPRWRDSLLRTGTSTPAALGDGQVSENSFHTWLGRAREGCTTGRRGADRWLPGAQATAGKPGRAPGGRGNGHQASRLLQGLQHHEGKRPGQNLDLPGGVKHPGG